MEACSCVASFDSSCESGLGALKGLCEEFPAGRCQIHTRGPPIVFAASAHDERRYSRRSRMPLIVA